MKSGRLPVACALTAALALSPLPARAASAAYQVDHRVCAANYAALSLALPYLPGVFLMFKIAWRSGHAQSVYGKEENVVSRKALRLATDERKKEILAELEAGETTLERLIITAHDCDAQYGLDPVPVTLDDLLRAE